MWSIENSSTGATNKYTMPADGIVSVVKPEEVKVRAFINDVPAPLHHIHTKLGDKVHFELAGGSDVDTSVAIEYAGSTSYIPVAATISTESAEGNIMTPAETVNLFANPAGNTGGAMGAGLGAGLLGGVLGGALIGNNGGGLFGGRNGDGGTLAASNINTENAIAATERLMNARFDAAAQADVLRTVEGTAAATQLALAVGQAALGVEIAKGQGEINTQVALTTGNLGTQNALNASAIGIQIQKTAGDTQTQLAMQSAALGVQNEKTAAANALAVAMAIQSSLLNQEKGFMNAQLTAMQNANTAAAQLAATQYTLATAVKSDGDLTRGLIIANNDAELNRRLITAQNEIIELRHDGRGRDRARETEVSVTQVVNQNQAQQQQQQQFQTTSNLLHALINQAQIAQATNQSLIIGNTGGVLGGAQTANPVNVRA